MHHIYGITYTSINHGKQYLKHKCAIGANLGLQLRVNFSYMWNKRLTGSEVWVVVGAEVCCCSLSGCRGLFKKLISTSSLLFSFRLLLPFRVLGEDPSAGGPDRGLIGGGGTGGAPSPKLLRLLGTLAEV